MKQLLLLPALGLSITGYCQRFEIGLNMGMSVSSKIDYPMPGSTNYNSRGGFSPYASAKYLLNFGHMQYGIGLDYVMPHASYKDMESGATAKVFYARPLLPVYLIANRKLDFNKNNTLYAGASLGIGYSLSSGTGNLANAINNPAITPLFGAQLGYTHYFGRLGLNAEFGAKWLPDLTPGKPNNTYSISSGTIGLRYRLTK